MVFAANGGTVVDGTVLGARFRHPQRAGEAGAYLAGSATRAIRGRAGGHVNEGEGDILFTGRVLLAGYGFRTDRPPRRTGQGVRPAGGEPAPGRPALLPPGHGAVRARRRPAMYYPAAFADAAQAAIAGAVRRADRGEGRDAEVLGLNAVSDGLHVVLPAQARNLAGQLRERGFEPIGVDLSELLKGGGGPKCCTLELRD